MPSMQVTVEIDREMIHEAVEALPERERVDLVAELVRDWVTGDAVEQEIRRLRDRIRFGGFDEGSALDVLERLLDVVEQERAAS